MNISVVGAGIVGRRLAKGWSERGHDVMFGVRNPDSESATQARAEFGDAVPTGSVAEAVAFGEVVVLAIRWPGAMEIIPAAGDWSGKVVLDTMNHFGKAGEVGESGAQEVARLAPGARVVKAFNHIGQEHMVDPQFDQPPTMLICGDDAEAKQVATGLMSEFGHDVVDAGPLSNAKWVEDFAQLWIWLANSGLGRNIAFRLMRR